MQADREHQLSARQPAGQEHAAAAAAAVIGAHATAAAAAGNAPFAAAAGASQVLDLPVSCVSRNFTTFDGLVTALEAAFALQAIAGKQAVAAA